jgi:hypothetical protein
MGNVAEPSVLEPSAAASRAQELLEAGFRAVAALEGDATRQAHLSAWLQRLSALDPDAAEARVTEIAEEPAQAHLLLTIITDRLRGGSATLEPALSRMMALLRGADAESRMRMVNALSEAALEVSDRDPVAAADLAKRLVPEALSIPGASDSEPPACGCYHGQPEPGQARALALALAGETLTILRNPEGPPILEQAWREAQGLSSREALTMFVVGALSESGDPQGISRAQELLQTVEDLASRLEATAKLAAKVSDPALRMALCGEVVAGALGESFRGLLRDNPRGPEFLTRLGQALLTLSPPHGMALLTAAWEEAADATPQFRALQWAGIAATTAGCAEGEQRERAADLFRQAIASLDEEPEAVKRVATRVVIANEMAGPFPSEAASLFERSMEDAQELEALWELAHVVELTFQADRSPYLEASAARPLLNAMLDRLQGEEFRMPGMIGLPDVARYMLQIDQEAALPLFRRWVESSAEAGDSDSLTQAAVVLDSIDPELSAVALREARKAVALRVDCMAMGQFARAIAPIAPRLALEVAPHIQDRRESADAASQAAVQLFRTEPAAALAVIEEIEQPLSRSYALLQIADTALGTSSRGLPEPIYEEGYY